LCPTCRSRIDDRGISRFDRSNHTRREKDCCVYSAVMRALDVGQSHRSASDVRSGSIATEIGCPRYVRFYPDSGRVEMWRGGVRENISVAAPLMLSHGEPRKHRNASGECQARDYSGVAFASEGVETNGRTSRSVRDADKRQLQILKDSADPYQTVKGWLLCYLSLTRGIE
jgi:hypothetical protein